MSNTAAIGPSTQIALEGPAKSRLEQVLRAAWRGAIVLLVLAIIGMAWLVRVAKPYEPDSTLGYNLGLAGGLMMLSLLLYPLRKRVRWFDRVGRMNSWFRFHMLFGVAGPLLILFHSTFQIGSMNARIALYAMLLVASSGLIGRFLYRHIHRGLYGRKLSLADAEQELKDSSAHMASVFALRPDIESRLKAFHQEAFGPLTGVGQRVWRFVSLRWRGHRLGHEVRLEVRQALKRHAREQRWSRAELALNYRLAREQIEAYLMAIVQASQLATWERLFSLWHVVHIPFLYLLLFSGVVHVIAVHIY